MYIYIIRQLNVRILKMFNISNDNLSLQRTREIIKSLLSCHLPLENNARTRLSHASCVNTFCDFHSFYERIVCRTHALSLPVCTHPKGGFRRRDTARGHPSNFPSRSSATPKLPLYYLPLCAQRTPFTHPRRWIFQGHSVLCSFNKR